MSTADLIQKVSRGAAEIISPANLQEKFKSSQKNQTKLRIKAGFDPTAPDIHLGHVVLLRKLRQFQDLGHDVFFLIGDFTAQIGDPTGRDKLRPRMEQKQVAQNAKTYQNQVFKILDRKKTKVVFNSSWLKKLKAEEMLALSQHSTVAQMLARADFKQRFEEQKEISLLEFFYPLLQGYDSVHLQADVELGGSDQKFNLLMGRQMQEAFGQSPQVVMMMPLLEGTDGVKKMSKSLDNYIGIEEAPKEIFGKIMSISDDLMMRYFELLTEVDLNEIKALHPKEAKLFLAEEIVKQFHSKGKAEEAREDFIRTFSDRGVPEDIAEYPFHGMRESLVEILIKNRLVDSKNAFRRLLEQGAISHEGKKIISEDWPVKEGVLKVGKRRFLRLKESGS